MRFFDPNRSFRQVYVQIVRTSVCLALTLSSASIALALPEPKLSTKLNDQTVLLQVTLPTTVKAGKLQIRRFSPEGEMSILTVSQAKKKTSLLDAASTPGTYRYRARVVKKKANSKWSKQKSIEVPDAEAPVSSPPAETTPTPLPPVVLAPGLSFCPEQFATDLLELVNNERAKVGAVALSLQHQLSWAAQTHSGFMGSNNSLTHNGWFEGILASGYSGTSFGQNVARWYAGPTQVFEGWMSSPGHKANMLKTSFRHLGVGCVLDGSGSAWWTQDFGG